MNFARAPHPRPRIRDNIKSWRWWFGIKAKVLAPASQSHRPSITVLVPAYNEEASIAKTIESILAQTYPVTEIIVIDDHSSDRTSEIASSFKGVVVVRTIENQGTKAQAQNYVLDRITTELFVTIDGDTMLAPDAIAETIPYFNDLSTGSVCGFVIPQRIESFWEYGRFGEYLYGLTMFKPAQNHSGIITVSSGCFSVYKTELVRELGGFPQRTLVEDMDLTWTMHSLGYRIYYTSKARCFPVEPPTFTIYVRQVERWLRGFFQNIKVRKFNLFPSGIGFALYIYFNLIWGVLSIVTMPLLLAFAVGSFGYGVLFALLGEMLFIGIFAVWRGAQVGMAKKAILSIFPTLVMQYFNRVLFIYSLWMEWILGKTLTTWHKGH
jgi:cellulose synthase/poly-beta-1,6-N-acetylglucosamine synthase-like glycosyltransferase